MSEKICIAETKKELDILYQSKKSEDKTEVLEYISKNEIVCRNCFQKRDSDIITN